MIQTALSCRVVQGNWNGKLKIWMFKLWLAVLTLKCTYRQDNSVNWARKRRSNFFLTMKAFCFITLSNLFYHKQGKVQIQLSNCNFITHCTCKLTEFSQTSSPTPLLNVKLQKTRTRWAEISSWHRCTWRCGVTASQSSRRSSPGFRYFV